MLANGRPYLAIPGPSVVPDRVLAAMHRPSPNIYEGELVEMTHALIPALRAVARTRHHAAIYMGNGHAGWEASLANVLRRGDRCLAPVTGHFGRLWARTAGAMGAHVEVIEAGPGGIDPGQVEAALRADLASGRGRPIRAVLAVHADTATSMRSDIAALRAAIDAAGHPALLMVDCIASLGCDRYEMDAWGADVTVAASQKGLMTPPGLAFVWFNDRADAARDEARDDAGWVTPYWDWRPRVRPSRYSDLFCGTAPTHHLYGLNEALAMIAEEGLEAVWARHAALARAVWAACGAWGEGGPLALSVADPALRSHAVTSVAIGSPLGASLRAWVEAKMGVTLGIGLGREPADAFFRIGHMGHVNAHMVLGVLGAIEAGLAGLGIPHGRGALEAAARSIAASAAAGDAVAA